jgi:adenine C2-methylase RlmN of 23S rRNA A2503 and tRNA A37
MGEPLNKYNAMLEAIKIITGPHFQLSPKRITVSTISWLKKTLLNFIHCFYWHIILWGA